jgi:uncharacterized protein YabE (DUF348 family)/3D (Asp-Asp-Asp) domain-containing protein
MKTVTLRDGLWTAVPPPDRSRLVFCLLVACLALIPLSVALSQCRVTLFVDGKSSELRTFSRDVAGVLNEAGVSVAAADFLSHQPAEPVIRGMTIEVKTAFPVTVLADGDEQVSYVAEAVVADVLAEHGISLRESDRVEPAADYLLQPGDTVRVTRVYQHLVTERTEIPFREIRRGNPRLDRGETRVVQRGINGLQQDTTEITLEDGVETFRETVQSDIIRTKQDRIVEYGENTVLSRGGRTVYFAKVLIVIATAYCPGTEGSGCPVDENGASKCTGHFNDGITAAGLPAVAGSGRENDPHIIAVDPRVIPLGARVYIDGYGFALAADVGSAIKGKRIDLLYSDHDTAWQFGRKRLRVYILN